MKVFLSYRRADTLVTAGHMAQFLEGVSAIRKVFLDIDDITIGENYEQRIADRIAAATHVFVLIGRQWLGSPDAGGRTRLFDPADVVGQELRLALASSARVVPILVDGALMPPPAELPEDLKDLSKINAFVLRTAHFGVDLDTLLDLLLDQRKGRGSRWRVAPLTPAQIVVRALGGLAASALLLVGLGLANRWFSDDCYDLTCRVRRSAGLAAEDDALALLLAITFCFLVLGALAPFVPRLLTRRH